MFDKQKIWKEVKKLKFLKSLFPSYASFKNSFKVSTRYYM